MSGTISRAEPGRGKSIKDYKCRKKEIQTEGDFLGKKNELNAATVGGICLKIMSIK